MFKWTSEQSKYTIMVNFQGAPGLSGFCAEYDRECATGFNTGLISFRLGDLQRLVQLKRLSRDQDIELFDNYDMICKEPTVLCSKN